MEIDIPDLDDVAFVSNCRHCRKFGVTTVNTDCWICQGNGVYLTDVGNRLLRFLEAVGCRPTDGWKRMEE